MLTWITWITDESYTWFILEGYPGYQEAKELFIRGDKTTKDWKIESRRVDEAWYIFLCQKFYKTGVWDAY